MFFHLPFQETVHFFLLRFQRLWENFWFVCLSICAVNFTHCDDLGSYYMVNFIPGWNFSPASETNPLKIKLSITWRGMHSARAKILARYFQTGLEFSARPNGLKNPCNRYHFFLPGPKKQREHAHRLCFRTSVNFLMEICVLRPGWNWACNRNNISARWAERNFSPGWNSPCNQSLTFLGLPLVRVSLVEDLSVTFLRNFFSLVSRRHIFWQRKICKSHLHLSR